MKKILIVLVTLFSSYSLMAQINDPDIDTDGDDEIRTLFDGVTAHGGYGGFNIGYTQIDNRDALVLGGRLGWVIDHKLTFGMAGEAFMNDTRPDPNLSNYNYNLIGGYGGVLLEPVIGSKYPVHVTIPVVIGAGGITYSRSYAWDEWDNQWYNYEEDTDAFFVLQPGVEFEMNLLKFLRFTAGVYYRYTSDVKLEYRTIEATPPEIVPKDVLHGFSYGISFKIGKF